MPDQNAPARIVAVDYTADSVFVRFANDVTVTYKAEFLFSSLEMDHNAVIATEAERPRAEGVDLDAVQGGGNVL